MENVFALPMAAAPDEKGAPEIQRRLLNDDAAPLADQCGGVSTITGSESYAFSRFAYF